MSPRPKNIRKVNNMPSVAGFRPVISNNSCEETIFLHFEEYETIRLCDYEMKTQQEASISMGVSRPTLSRIYTSARQKIAKAFVCGAAIMIEGGVSYTNSEWFRCGSCGFLFNNINPALKIRKTVCPVCLSEDIHTSNININKNKIMMKIAIPTRDNVIDNHFGHCEYYTILTVGQDNQILSSETIPSPQGCGCKSNIAGELEGMGVSVMLAGNMGQGALNVLTAHHIKVIRGCSGNILNVATVCMGSKADQPINRRLMMFVPFYVQDFFNTARIVDNEGQARPLVSSEEKIVVTGLTDADHRSGGITPMQSALLLFVLVAAATIYGIRRGKTLWGLDLILFFCAGIAGCILAFLALFSQHPAVSPNYLLFVFHPLHLFCLPWMINKVRKRQKSWYMRTNCAVLTLFILLWAIIPQRIDLAVLPLALCLLVRSASNLILTLKKR